MSNKALEQHGRLVAIEGPPSVVATQLKLIPKSPTHLVIPSIATYLDEKGAYGEAFDARRYIFHVHHALEAQYKEAMGFLHGSSHPKVKRIAFLNGGICAAHALCISAIKQNMPNGSLSRAGIIFDQIMREGMEGVLMGGILPPPQRPLIGLGDNYARLLHDSHDDDDESDPVIRAMRRADALYERTASLDLSGYSNAEPSSIAATTSLAVPNIRYSRMSRNSRSSHFSHMSSSLQTPDTSQVEYGEARLVQMQPVVPTALKRVKSADRWYTRAELDAGTSPLALSRTQSTRTAPAVYTTTPEASKLDANCLRVTPPSPDNDGSADGQDQGTPQLSLDSATGSSRPSRAVREAKRQETLLALRGQAPLKSLEQLMPCREDLIVLLEDAALDPVLQFTSDNLVEAGLPIHVCSPHHSAQAVSDDHDRLPAERRSAIETQNALRSFLAEILPVSPEYDASLFGEVENTDSLWESISEASVEIKRPYDMVLAVGAQDSVPKDYSRRVMCQLEDLGYKSLAEPRTRRIELSQLIGSAMQSYTSQPLASQTHTNPFADAALLAALLVSEINTFLSTTPEARYIILDFPAQHLPTVFAMQSIMDNESFKVAGIVDENDEDVIRDFRKGRNKNREYQVARSPTERSPQAPTFSIPSSSFSKVDYLLRSEAGEAEEAIFLNAIWNRLIEIDESYAPDAGPSGSFNPDDILPPPSVPTSPRNVRFHIPFMAPDSPPESPPGRPPTVAAPSEHGYLASTLFPAPATYTTLPPTHHQSARPASPDPTIASRGSSRKTNWSFRLGRQIHRSGGIGIQRNLSRLFSRSAAPKTEHLAGPVLPPPGLVELGDEDYEEEDGEGELDLDERRLLPLFGQRRREGMGSAKAMRMLGID